MTNPTNHLKFADTHEWVQLDGNIATCGISDHAQALLGDLVYVELPEVGTTFGSGDEIAVVESVKAASDVYAPISGKVIKINEELEGSPEQVNQDPYSTGWLYQIEMTDTSEMDELMDAEAYHNLISEPTESE